MSGYFLFLAFLIESCGPRNETAEPPPPDPTPLQIVQRLAEVNSGFGAPQTGVEAYPDDIQKILERGSIVFAMPAADSKPFFYHEPTTGEFIGVDVEIAYEIANRLGVRAIFNREAANHDGVAIKVANKEADIGLSKLSRTMRRAELVRFTRPYIVFRQAMLVNRLEFAKIGTEDKLPGYFKNFKGRLGVLKNSSYQTYAATNFPASIIEPFDTWGEAVDALFAGKILAIYRDEGEIQIVNATREDAAILMKMVFINDQQDPIGIAVAPDEPLLQEWLNVFLEEYLRQNPEKFIISRFVRQHYGAASPVIQ